LDFDITGGFGVPRDACPLLSGIVCGFESNWGKFQQAHLSEYTPSPAQDSSFLRFGPEQHYPFLPRVHW